MTAASQSPVALLTGAAGRIGAVLARRLASEGYAVVVHHNTGKDTARALAADIRALGGRAETVGADLTSRKQRAGLIAKAAKPFGPLTVLINNASLYQPDSAADLDESLWDDHFSIHVEAPLFLARDFAAQLPEDALGNIVNIIDERVLQLTPAYLSYTLSKSTLWTATRLLAQSLAPRIRVNAIGPGPTLVEAGQSAAAFERATKRLPLQHGAVPGDLADALMFILSAGAFTGQMLALDGGSHLSWPERRKPTPRK